MPDDNLIERYPPRDRFNHWLTAISFVLLAASGLALFHPAFYWLSNLLGGGPWTRILHPFIGLVLAVSFGILARRYWPLNRITDADRAWIRRLPDVLAKRDQDLPEVGQYNAGQKYLFWTLVASVAVLLVSGFVIWQPWFTWLFPVTLVRLAVLGHALAAFVIMAGIVVHIYAALWVKGSLRAMTRGTVSHAWAKHHHPGWYRQLGKGGR